MPLDVISTVYTVYITISFCQDYFCGQKWWGQCIMIWMRGTLFGKMHISHAIAVRNTKWFTFIPKDIHSLVTGCHEIEPSWENTKTLEMKHEIQPSFIVLFRVVLFLLSVRLHPVPFISCSLSFLEVGKGPGANSHWHWVRGRVTLERLPGNPVGLATGLLPMVWLYLNGQPTHLTWELNLWGIVKRKMRHTRPNNPDELKPL